jgi:hypothetical protein
MTRAPFPPTQRVNRENPCSVCGKPDWCATTSDGRFALCKREEDWNGVAAIRRTDGGWLHVLTGGRPPAAYTVRAATYKSPPLPDRRVLDRVYRQLVALSPIDEHAYCDLVEHRRFPEAATLGIYFSLPRSGKTNEHISEQLIAQFGEDVISRVPGFSVVCKDCSAAGTTSGVLCISCGGLGRLRPRFRSVRGQRHDYGVIACDENGLAFWGASRTLPYDAATGRAKYILFSSSRAGDPSVSGLPKYHVAGRQYPATEVWFTEGVTKAEITARALRTRVIGFYSTSIDAPTLAEVTRLAREWSPCS